MGWSEQQIFSAIKKHFPFLSVYGSWKDKQKCFEGKKSEWNIMGVHSEVFGVKSMSSSWGRRHLYYCRIKLDFDFDQIRKIILGVCSI